MRLKRCLQITVACSFFAAMLSGQVPPGQYMTATASIKAGAPKKCQHKPVSATAAGCNDAACMGAQQAAHDKMFAAVGLDCGDYIEVSKTCKPSHACNGQTKSK